uniref:Toxin Tf2 n=3 Tax=Tityus TaxID=6886 RepID=SCX2_TITFA|nr:RecName: Full=Toxin Tf2; Flags: Precursor [Tityus fasciolatus]CEF39517.1 Tf2 [Tityus fasciolatus]
MKRFLLFISILMMIGTIVVGKEGYAMDHEGCKFSCFIRPSGFCDGYCKTHLKASSGYCAWPACYCYGVPSNIKVWDYATNKCGK